MRKWVITMCGGALLLGGLSLRTFGADEKKESKTVQGELIDTYCYSTGGAQGEGHGSCGAKCAKSGIPVAVLVDGKAWTLATNPKPLADAMGKQVKVTGTANADTMTFIPETVEMKEGDNWKQVKLSDAHHKGGEMKTEEKKEEKKEEK